MLPLAPVAVRGGSRLCALPVFDSVLNRLVLDDTNSPEVPATDEDGRSRCGVPFDRDETRDRLPLSASQLYIILMHIFRMAYTS